MRGWRRRSVLVGLVASWGLGSAALAWQGCTPRTLTAGPDGAFPPFDSFAPPLDVAEPDVSPGDAGPQPATIVVLAEATPVAGVRIVWSDATGAMLGTSTTDAAGSASMLVASGSQVTALLGTSAAPQLLTYVGVEPGDVLTALQPTIPGTSSLTANVTVVNAEPGGSTYTSVYSGPCSDYYGTVSGPFSHYVSPGQDCIVGSTFPVLVEAHDNTNAITGYVSHNGNVGDLDAGTANVSVTGAWNLTTDTQRIDVTSFPDSGFATAVFSEIADGVALSKLSSVSGNPDGGATSATFTTHPAYPDSFQSEVNLTLVLANETVSAIATRAKPKPGAVTPIDLSTLLPLLSSTKLDTSLPGRPVVTFSSAQPITSDGTIVWFQADEALDGSSLTHTWTFVVPPNAQTTTVVTAPLLPAAAGAWRATGLVTTFDVPTVISVEADTIKDYAALRHTVGALPNSIPEYLLRSMTYGGPTVPPLPFDGTLRFTAYTPFKGG